MNNEWQEIITLLLIISVVYCYLNEVTDAQVALETEAIGAEILGDLHTQRSGIERARTRVRVSYTNCFN